MDFRAIRAIFDRISALSGSSVNRPRRHKAARKFVEAVTQSLQKNKVCGVHNTNCAVSSSFWNIFRKVAKNAKFLDFIPKSLPVSPPAPMDAWSGPGARESDPSPKAVRKLVLPVTQSFQITKFVEAVTQSLKNFKVCVVDNTNCVDF